MPARTRAAIATRTRAEFALARRLTALPAAAQVRLSGRPPVRIDGQTLEFTSQLVLALSERQGRRPVHQLSLAAARADWREQCVMAARHFPVGDVRQVSVDGADGLRPGRHYSPPAGGAPAPLLVYFHGGGWVVCDLDSHDSVCRLLCLHAGVHVVSVDYRLAPEHPFPAAVEDARAALGWAFAQAAALGADPHRIGVGGDSAGGNLAAVVAQLAARDGGPAPVAQLLIYPGTDFVERRRSRELFGEGFFLTSADMDWFAERYAGAADHADPRLSPLRAADLSGLPSALVITGGFDPLRDEGEAYAAALTAAGNRVVARRFSGLIHGFANATAMGSANLQAMLETAGAARALLHAPC